MVTSFTVRILASATDTCSWVPHPQTSVMWSQAFEWGLCWTRCGRKPHARPELKVCIRLRVLPDFLIVPVKTSIHSAQQLSFQGQREGASSSGWGPRDLIQDSWEP